MGPAQWSIRRKTKGFGDIDHLAGRGADMVNGATTGKGYRAAKGESQGSKRREKGPSLKLKRG